MKLLLALFAIALVGVGVSACGGVSKDRGSASSSSHGVTQTRGYIRGDYDEDGDGYDDSDDPIVLAYGHVADAAEERPVAAVVRRYLVAAAAENGHVACPLLYSGINRGSKLLNAIPLPYTPGAHSPMRGKSCAEDMSRLFKEDRKQLVSEIGSLQVIGMRVHGSYGLALLGFSTTHERFIPVAREGGVWKIAALLDSPVP